MKKMKWAMLALVTGMAFTLVLPGCDEGTTRNFAKKLVNQAQGSKEAEKVALDFVKSCNSGAFGTAKYHCAKKSNMSNLVEFFEAIWDGLDANERNKTRRTQVKLLESNVNDGIATVKIGAGSSQYKFKLRRENDAWKIFDYNEL